ncbi:MAG: exosome complex RNA-binding protein Csl4 [Desulfurococcales archaeon]|nr:exosome complex RNA-binding protein Csl4 [Desulfurococcales archaeon]
MSSSSLRGKPVMPGEYLGVIEEYIPGSGVYVDSEGVIRAAYPGVLNIDRTRRTISVTPFRLGFIHPPRQGETVLGMVTSIRTDLVVVEIHAKVLLGRGGPRIVGEYKGKLTGAIPIAHIANERIKDIYEYYKLNDIILAKTLNSSNPYTLTTKEPQLGVVYAECARCGHPLEPHTNRLMKCRKCGNTEPRKVSTLAGHKAFASLKWWLRVPHRF